MTLTTTLQGSFTSTGVNTFIPLESGVDWMVVYNLNQANAAQTVAVGVKYYWQNGFAQNSKWVTFKSNAVNAANLEQYITTNGFQYQDTSIQQPGMANVTVESVTGAAVPVVLTSLGTGLVAGNIVRLYNIVGAEQLGGIDFTVGNSTLTNTSFSLDYMSQIVAAAEAGDNAAWALIPYDPIYYPTHRYITAISQAANAVVTLSVTHGYQVGQTLRMVVPAVYGMSQMNGLLGIILAVNAATNTVTVNINSIGFTAFAFPVTADVAFTPAMTVPVGEDTATALANNVNILSDATVNTAQTGMLLTGGVNNPGGANDDVIFWMAGKTFSNTTD